MKKVVLFLILMLNVQGFMVSCGCPDENFFDFRAIQIELYDTFVPIDEDLSFGVFLHQTYFLTSNSRFSHFNNTAYATIVCEKGRDGLKYEIVEVSIFSDSDFNESHPAGTNLNDIVKAYGNYDNSLNGHVFDHINLLDPNQLAGTTFVLEIRPETEMTHRFEVRFEKVNGDIVTGFSDEITWE